MNDSRYVACAAAVFFAAVAWSRACDCNATAVRDRNASGVDERPWLIVNLDNNHYQHQFSDNEQTVPAIEKYIDEYLGAAATHIFINPNAMRAFYDSKVLEPIWNAFDEPGAQTDIPWLRRAKLLHDRGIDVYAVMLNRIRSRDGAEGWISMRMNDVHCVNNPRSSLVGMWWLRRPDLWRVPFDSSGSWGNRAFDYSHKEVREHHVAAARELFDRYDMDGFEADWTRFPWHLTPGKERSQAECLTEVMREIRKAANAAAARRGHPVKVAAAVLSSHEAAIASGMDAVAWAQEGARSQSERARSAASRRRRGEDAAQASVSRRSRIQRLFRAAYCSGMSRFRVLQPVRQEEHAALAVGFCRPWRGAGTCASVTTSLSHFLPRCRAKGLPRSEAVPIRHGGGAHGDDRDRVRHGSRQGICQRRVRRRHQGDAEVDAERRRPDVCRRCMGRTLGATWRYQALRQMRVSAVRAQGRCK